MPTVAQRSILDFATPKAKRSATAGGGGTAQAAAGSAAAAALPATSPNATATTATAATAATATAATAATSGSAVVRKREVAAVFRNATADAPAVQRMEVEAEERAGKTQQRDGGGGGGASAAASTGGRGGTAGIDDAQRKSRRIERNAAMASIVDAQSTAEGAPARDRSGRGAAGECDERHVMSVDDSRGDGSAGANDKDDAVGQRSKPAPVVVVDLLRADIFGEDDGDKDERDERDLESVESSDEGGGSPASKGGTSVGRKRRSESPAAGDGGGSRKRRKLSEEERQRREQAKDLKKQKRMQEREAAKRKKEEEQQRKQEAKRQREEAAAARRQAEQEEKEKRKRQREEEKRQREEKKRREQEEKERAKEEKRLRKLEKEEAARREQERKEREEREKREAEEAKRQRQRQVLSNFITSSPAAKTASPVCPADDRVVVGKSGRWYRALELPPGTVVAPQVKKAHQNTDASFLTPDNDAVENTFAEWKARGRAAAARRVRTPSPLADVPHLSRMKLIKMDGSRQYFGTFTQESEQVNGRRPFTEDTSGAIDYDEESEDEEEEPLDGESLSDVGEDDDEEEEEGMEEGMGEFFVPTGYLSDEEGVNRGAEDRVVRKMAEERGADKLQKLQPIILGPVFDLEASDPGHGTLAKYRIQMIPALPEPEVDDSKREALVESAVAYLSRNTDGERSMAALIAKLQNACPGMTKTLGKTIVTELAEKIKLPGASMKKYYIREQYRSEYSLPTLESLSTPEPTVEIPDSPIPETKKSGEQSSGRASLLDAFFGKQPNESREATPAASSVVEIDMTQ